MTVTYQDFLHFARVMRDFHFPWFVSGGWAIDLFLNRVTREHADVEIGVYRRDQLALQQYLASALPSYELLKSIQTPSGGQWIPWDNGEQLELPIHQILARPRQADQKELEFFLNERTETRWLSRRHEGLTRPLGEVYFASQAEIPALSPEIQLLFKAKYVRDKDQADFNAALPQLNAGQRAWLLKALGQYHPNHPWIDRLTDPLPNPSPEYQGRE